MPLRIRNKEIARVDALQKSIYRQDSGASGGTYHDPVWYNCGQLPIFLRSKLEESLRDKPVFMSRVASGGNFSKGLTSETPCKLNLIDILDVKRHWAVMEEQCVKHGTMAKKFNVVAGDARDRPPCGTTHNTAYIARRSKEDLKEEVPLIYLPSPLLDRCSEASHSHVPSCYFPMGATRRDRQELMNENTADTEVAAINTANDRGHGEPRNDSQNMSATPSRLLQKRAFSPQKLARSKSAASFLSSGTMMSERTFCTPGLPDVGFENSGYTATPMGLPHIAFAKKPKPPKIKPWMTRRGSLTTVQSKGWEERDMTRSLSSLS